MFLKPQDNYEHTLSKDVHHTPSVILQLEKVTYCCGLPSFTFPQFLLVQNILQLTDYNDF